MFKQDHSNDATKLKKENESLLKQIKDIDNKLEELDAQVTKSEDFINKLNNVEKRLVKLVEVEKIIYEKDCKLEELAKRVDDIKALHIQKDDTIKSPEELVKSKKLQKNHHKIACQECEFEANSTQGLKVHMKRKHTFNGKEG